MPRAFLANVETSQGQKTMFSFLGLGIKRVDIYLKQPWVQVPTLPPIGCVTRDKLLNVSVAFLL